MSMISIFRKELDQESVITRKMLQRIPDDKYDWKPHAKSMTTRQLATHIAELPTWITMVLTTDELDFASSPYNPARIEDTKMLMAFFETSLENGHTELKESNESKLEGNWTLRDGDAIFVSCSRADMIRSTLNQITHHRAQMGVYLRLLDIPIPGSYGPSADESF